METGETFPIFETDKYFIQYVRELQKKLKNI